MRAALAAAGARAAVDEPVLDFPLGQHAAAEGGRVWGDAAGADAAGGDAIASHRLMPSSRLEVRTAPRRA